MATRTAERTEAYGCRIIIMPKNFRTICDLLSRQLQRLSHRSMYQIFSSDESDIRHLQSFSKPLLEF